jgi:hypothetical protein
MGASLARKQQRSISVAEYLLVSSWPPLAPLQLRERLTRVLEGEAIGHGAAAQQAGELSSKNPVPSSTRSHTYPNGSNFAPGETRSANFSK